MANGDRAPASAPSGEQIEIVAGDQRLVVVEVGGGIRTYTIGEHELLDGYRADEMAQSARGDVLAPWPNRIRDGSYAFGGGRHQLPLTEPEQHNAIHGLVRWVSWSVRERAPARVVMGHVLHPQPGYPFALDLSLEYALSDDGLTVRQTATNIGPTDCPFGAGAHPWLEPGGASVDAAVLRIPAGSVLHPDDRGIPVSTASVEGTELDFRDARPIGATQMDHAFTDLDRGPDGNARVTLDRTDGHTSEVWFDRNYPYVMITTGDVLPDVDRHSLAVEPMTCPPNAFQTGEAIIVLAPGATFTGTWGITTDLVAGRRAPMDQAR